MKNCWLRFGLPSLLLSSSLTLILEPSASCDDSFKVGAIFSTSGWGAEGGTAEMDGVRLAQDEINRAGGIHGHPLDIVYEDNHSELKDTATAFHKLADVDGVKAILGPNWAEFIEVAAPLARKSKIPVLTATGYKEGVFVKNPYAFTLWPTHEVTTKPLSSLLIKRGYKKVAVLMSETAFYVSALAAVKSQLKDSSVTLMPTQSFNPGHQDFRSVISRIKGDSPDAVLVFLVPGVDLLSFLKQAKELRLTQPLFGGDSIAFDPEIQKDPSVAEGVIYFDYVRLGGEAFRKKYRDAYSKEPAVGADKAYDSVFVLKDAIERCGISSTKIAECISSTSISGITGPIAFNSNGVINNMGNNTLLMEIKGGKILPFQE